MKKVLVSLACLVVLVAFYACSNTGNEDLNTSGSANAGIRFERVSPDALGADLAGRISQNHAEEGYQLLASGNDNYIVVYAGERPTAGYSIEITNIIAEEGTTRVTAKETSPAKGGVTAQVLTYPFDVARLESAISGSVEIEIVKDNAG